MSKHRKPKHKAKHRKPSVIGRILAFRRRSNAGTIHRDTAPRGQRERDALQREVDS